MAIALLTAGLIFLVRRWPKDIHHTFSQHAATNKASTIYYVVLFAAILPVLAIFFFSWFVPIFNVPPAFSILIVLSLVCQLVCTLIPEVGKYVKLHRALAGISGVLLLPSLIICTFAQGLDMADKALAIVGAVIMAIILVLVAGKKVRYALVLQTAYFGAFFVPILAISYI